MVMMTGRDQLGIAGTGLKNTLFSKTGVSSILGSPSPAARGRSTSYRVHLRIVADHMVLQIESQGPIPHVPHGLRVKVTWDELPLPRCPPGSRQNRT